MLGGADLKPKFWLYAFHHFLCLYNVTPHGNNEKSPFEICTGNKPNLCYLHTFSCSLWVLHPDKAISDACKGIFLGFTRTMKNVIYYDCNDLEIETFETAQHVAFDEAMNDSSKKQSPNAQLLDGLKHGNLT